MRFPHLEWPELPNTSLHRLRLPKINQQDFQLEYPDFEWPATPNLAFLCNLMRIAFPSAAWPELPEYNFDTEGADWDFPEWELPHANLSAVHGELRARFPHLTWPELPHVQLASLALPRLNLDEYEVHYPHLSPWPSVPDLRFLLNLLRLAFPELGWPAPPDWTLPEISASELSLPDWVMPDWSLLEWDLTASFLDGILVKMCAQPRTPHATPTHVHPRPLPQPLIPAEPPSTRCVPGGRRILISMIQVLSQLGVVYSIPFPGLYANLLRWVGALELNFVEILPLGCVYDVSFYEVRTRRRASLVGYSPRLS